MPPENTAKPQVESEAELTMKIFRNVGNGTETVTQAFAEIQKDREMYGMGSEKEQIYTERIRAKLEKENLIPKMSLHYAQENYYPISGEKFIDEGSLTAFRKGKYDKMTPVEKAFNHYLRNNFDDLDHTTEDNKNVVDKKDLSKKLNALNGKGESEEVKAEVKKDDSANNLENASGRIGVSASIEADHRAVADAASDCLSDEVWRLGWNAIGDGLKNNFVDPIADACENYREEQERQDEEFRSLSKGLAKRVGDFIEWDLNVSREISKYLPIPRLF